MSDPGTRELSELHDYLVSYGAKRSWPELVERVAAVGDAIVLPLQGQTREKQLGNIARQFCAKINIVDPAESKIPSILPRPGGFDISVPIKDKHRVSERELFDLAHELGHCLFYDEFEPSPRRLSSGTSSRATINWQEEENLCNIFARAVLFPIYQIGDIAENEGDIAGFCKYCDQHGFSPDLLATRILHDLKLWQRQALYLVPQPLRPAVKFGGMRLYRGDQCRRASSRTDVHKELEKRALDVRTLNEVLVKLCSRGRKQPKVATFQMRRNNLAAIVDYS